MRFFPEAARPALAPYVALAVLFLAESIYLGRFAFFVFPGLFGAHPAREPFIVTATDQPGAIAGILFEKPEAVQAGLKQGDLLVAIDGQPRRGWRCSVRRFGAIVRGYPCA